MLGKILPLVNKYIPGALAWKGLEKVSPEMRSFMKGALAAGYGTNEVIDFIRNKAESSKELESEKQGSRKNALLSEKATASDVRKQRSNVDTGTTAASLAAGAVGGAAGAAIPAIAGLLGEGGSKPSKESTSQPPEDVKRKALQRLSKSYNETAKPQQTKKRGLVETETERFQQQYGQGSGSQELMQAMAEMKNLLGG